METEVKYELKKKTLIELGNRLPIPDKDGKRHSFSFKPWRMAEEKAIGEIKKKHKHLGRFVREVFDFMLSELNGFDWQAHDKNQRKLILSEMSWGNVYYMWCVLRNEALGNEMKMQQITCPACEFDIKGYKADLESLEVYCAGMNEEGGDVKAEDIPQHFDYQLKKPFKFGEINVTHLRSGFTPWRAMEKIPAQERNAGQIKESMLFTSLMGAMAEESDQLLTNLDKKQIMENLTKRDIEGYFEEIDEFNGGPILALEVECPSCGYKDQSPLNWTYDYFFGNGSL